MCTSLTTVVHTTCATVQTGPRTLDNKLFREEGKIRHRRDSVQDEKGGK